KKEVKTSGVTIRDILGYDQDKEKKEKEPTGVVDTVPDVPKDDPKNTDPTKPEPKKVVSPYGTHVITLFNGQNVSKENFLIDKTLGKVLFEGIRKVDGEDGDCPEAKNEQEPKKAPEPKKTTEPKKDSDVKYGPKPPTTQRGDDGR